LLYSEDDDGSNDDDDGEEDDDVLCDMRSDSGQRSPDFNDDTKSRFTEYSMTSSVIRRNAQLSLLDDRFEQVLDLISFTRFKVMIFMAFICR
jgi:protein LTV1